MGYSSLFEFATRELGYSAGAAFRRIQSMRLLKSLPDSRELEQKIEEGSLSLCVAAKTQSFFKQEDKRRVRLVKADNKNKLPPLSTQEKHQILKSMLSLSTRECERKLTELLPETAELQAQTQSSTRLLPQERMLIQFIADENLMQKLERLRELLAHQNFDGNHSKLIELMADIALKKLEPKSAHPKSVPPSPAPKPAPKPALPKSALPALEKSPSPQSHAQSQTQVQTKKCTRYLSVAVRRAVKNRDGGQCTYRDPLTGRRCTTRHAIQFDHATPFAWGGQNSTENIRLRCSAHNAYTAQQMGLGDHSQNKRESSG